MRTRRIISLRTLCFCLILTSGTLRAQSPVGIETRVPNTSLLIDLVNGDAPETISASRLYADLDEGFSAFLLKPVRAEQLYATIGHQLGVAFDLADDVAEEGDGTDLTATAIPETLRVALLEAARHHSITDMNALIGQLAATGDEQHALAVHLQQMMGRYDLMGVRAVVEELPIT